MSFYGKVEQVYLPKPAWLLARDVIISKEGIQCSQADAQKSEVIDKHILVLLELLEADPASQGTILDFDALHEKIKATLGRIRTLLMGESDLQMSFHGTYFISSKPELLENEGQQIWLAPHGQILLQMSEEQEVDRIFKVQEAGKQRIYQNRLCKFSRWCQ